MKKAVTTIIVLLLGAPGAARAQNWSFDARDIALGGFGGTGNLSTSMIEDQRPSFKLVIPLGLLQVLGDRERLNPASDDFDIARTIEYGLSPLHYVINRKPSLAAEAFISDIREGRLDKDLNRYRGFVPANQPSAQGAALPSFGGTIKVKKGEQYEPFHGIYLGAGPYITGGGSLTTDADLNRILGSATPLYLPNAHMPVSSVVSLQTAIGIQVGYRGYFTPRAFETGALRDGLYVAVNYNVLRGVFYEDGDIAVRLDTDAAGLLTVDRTRSSPFRIARENARNGMGGSIDTGASIVMGRWEFGGGVSGIANYINWNDVERRTYSLSSLIDGGDFIETVAQRIGSKRVEMPLDLRTNLAYHKDTWSAMSAVGKGRQGSWFRAGYEKRFQRLELRAGASRYRERWSPTGGIGVNLSPSVGLDFAAYRTGANLERVQRTAIALSLRIGGGAGPSGRQ